MFLSYWSYTISSTRCSENGSARPGQSVALLETPTGVTVISQKPLNDDIESAAPTDNDDVQHRGTANAIPDHDSSVEYGTDRESNGVYNPTTVPLSKVMASAGGRNSTKFNGNAKQKPDDNEENSDLLAKGNQLGIPESRYSRWIPKDQRELLEKQAKLLAHRIKPKTPEPARLIRTEPPQPQETEI